MFNITLGSPAAPSAPRPRQALTALALATLLGAQPIISAAQEADAGAAGQETGENQETTTETEAQDTATGTDTETTADAGDQEASADAGDDAGNWINTWTASPQSDWGPDFFAPVGIPRSLRDQTVRQIARISEGGDQVRVEFSNEYGEHPLVIGEAHVALAGENGAIVPDSDRVLTFGGEQSIIVPPGAPVWSDPVDLPVEDLASLAVSLYLPEVAPTTTWVALCRMLRFSTSPLGI